MPEAHEAAVLERLEKMVVSGEVSPEAPGHPFEVPVCAPTTATPIQKAATADAQADAKVEADPLDGFEMAASNVLAMALRMPAVMVGVLAPKVPAEQ